ncbi:MAG: hypothetical protein QM655_07885 [Nocardioidaceae bacterium]
MLTTLARAKLLALIWWRRSATPTLLFCTAIAITVAVSPTLLRGTNTGLGLSSVTAGLFWGQVAGCVVGCACVLGLGLAEYEGGLRAARHLSGATLGDQSVIQWVAALIHAVASCLIVLLSTVGAALFDVLFRHAAGDPGRLLPSTGGIPDEWIAIASLAMVVGVTATWLLLTGVRSSRAASLLIAVGFGSWIAMLVATRTMGNRVFLAAHPLAAPWHALHLTASPSLTLEAPNWLYWCSALGWTAGIVAAAVASIRRP